jgi:hypothetical protein
LAVLALRRRVIRPDDGRRLCIKRWGGDRLGDRVACEGMLRHHAAVHGCRVAVVEYVHEGYPTVRIVGFDADEWIPWVDEVWYETGNADLAELREGWKAGRYGEFAHGNIWVLAHRLAKKEGVYPRFELSRKYKNWWASLRGAFGLDRPYVAVHARNTETGMVHLGDCYDGVKAVPLDWLEEVLRTVRKKWRVPLVRVGAAKDRVRDLDVDGLVDLTQEGLTPLESSAVVCAAALNLSSDAGFSHIGAAAGVPTVQYWQPWGRWMESDSVTDEDGTVWSFDCSPVAPEGVAEVCYTVPRFGNGEGETLDVRELRGAPVESVVAAAERLVERHGIRW